ncbi:uncharacterized protein F4812DRAFT_281820 [Daldinia caldariorum]|uniref:uncharacterized protein n=1 Tax=Daldinia caldariorum TaxID=326644 RepID=UPI0020074F59|nr:uncharacterized protein F4812DRAFT_281820 [Daldinia caldariorum]KAI1470876.1 hypothetical protein F4812DRAFT_281820 [Daldinia caldariorum]
MAPHQETQARQNNLLNAALSTFLTAGSMDLQARLYITGEKYKPGDDDSDVFVFYPEYLRHFTGYSRSSGETLCIDPPMLKALAPTKTRLVPITANPYWSLIDHTVREAILKVLSDDLGSLQDACYKLELFVSEVREILERRQKLFANSFALKEESIAYGCRFLFSRGLGGYSESLREYGRHVHEWPLAINLSDLRLDALPKCMKYIEPTVEFLPHGRHDSQARVTQNPGTERFFSLSTESVAISARVNKTMGGRLFSTVNSFRLPAGVVVISPQGTKQLGEGGTYTVINPPLPESYVLHQFVICDNAVKLPKSPKTDFQSSFFDDTISHRTRVVERAVVDNLVPRRPTATDADFAHFLPELLLQPRKDALCLQPATEDLAMRGLNQQGYSALLQIHLPPGYLIISPSGCKMNLDIAPINERDGDSSPGHGGEYIFVPPEHAIDPSRYREITRAKSDIAWIVFNERMAVFRDGKMFPRLVGNGLHRLSTRNGELVVSCADGEYDLAKALRNPDPSPMFRVQSLPTSASGTAPNQSMANPPSRNNDHGPSAGGDGEIEKENGENNSYATPSTAASALTGASQDRKRKTPHDVIELPQNVSNPGLQVHPPARPKTQSTTQEEANSQAFKPKPFLELLPQALSEPELRNENEAQPMAQLEAQPMAVKKPRLSDLMAENAEELIGSAQQQQSTTAPPPAPATQEKEALPHPQDEAKAQPEEKKKKLVRIVLVNKKTAAPAAPQEQSGFMQDSGATTQQTPTGVPEAQPQTQHLAEPQPERRKRGRPRGRGARPAVPRGGHSAGGSSTHTSGGDVSLGAPQANSPQTETAPPRTDSRRGGSRSSRPSSRPSGGQ